MITFPIYCTCKFLESLFTIRKTEYVNLLERNEILIDKAIFNYILSRNEVYLDGDLRDYIDIKNEKYNPYFKLLLKSRKPPTIEAFLNNKIINKEVQKNAVLFADDNEIETSLIEERHGILVITPNNKYRREIIFNQQQLLFQKKTFGNMSILRRFQLPINSLTVADPYILVSENARINLYNLIKFLMPNKLFTKFDLKIIIQYNVNNAEVNTEEKKILKFLKSQFNYDINVKIYIGKFHDRILLTNNYIIECGHGFELFWGNKVSKTTILNFYPILKLEIIKPSINENSLVFNNSINDLFSKVYLEFQKIIDNK